MKFLEQLTKLHSRHAVLSKIYPQFGKKELHWFNLSGPFYYARQLYRQVLLRARISYGNSVRLSVRPGVTTRYRIKPRSDRDTGFVLSLGDEITVYT